MRAAAAHSDTWTRAAEFRGAVSDIRGKAVLRPVALEPHGPEPLLALWGIRLDLVGALHRVLLQRSHYRECRH